MTFNFIEIHTQYWAENVLSPSVSEDCLLLLDSWSGQIDRSIYDDIFVENITCKQMQIPPKTKGDIQPLDRYFFDNGNILNKKFMIAWPLIKSALTSVLETAS